ncbi:MAG: transposase [Planctomycetes bacterium]|nr:transposase [Planctomycetota bacterium]
MPSIQLLWPAPVEPSNRQATGVSRAATPLPAATPGAGAALSVEPYSGLSELRPRFWSPSTFAVPTGGYGVYGLFADPLLTQVVQGGVGVGYAEQEPVAFASWDYLGSVLEFGINGGRSERTFGDTVTLGPDFFDYTETVAHGEVRVGRGLFALETAFLLRLNVHFHVVWLDGVYSWQPGRGEVAWHEHEGLTDADVAAQVRRIGARVTRELKKAGKWWDEGDAADASEVVDGEQQTMLTLASGAVTGRAALGERAGQIDVRVGRGTRAEPFVKGPLCADHDGFSLHAGVRVAAGDRKRLEHLLRYAGRAAIAESRLSLLPDGRVAYSLKRRWKDGSTHVVMEPEVLIERLLALVPPPRRHLVTYHGVLAPAAGLRSRVVPRVDEVEAVADEGVDAVPEQRAVQAVLALRLRRRTVPHAPNGGRPGCATMRRRRYPWAELLRRVFAIDVLVCPHCGGVRRLLAAITAPDAIEKVLRAMGLPCEVAQVAPARAPPGGPEWWGA